MATITLPLVGKIRSRGKTTFEAEQTIAGTFDKNTCNRRKSRIGKAYGKRITISGEVKVSEGSGR